MLTTPRSRKSSQDSSTNKNNGYLVTLRLTSTNPTTLHVLSSLLKLFLVLQAPRGANDNFSSLSQGLWKQDLESFAAWPYSTTFGFSWIFLYTISACIQFIKWVKGKHCWIITVVAGSVDIGFDDYSWGARKINKKELGSTLSAAAKHLRRHKQPPHGQLSWLSSRGQKCRLLRRCFKRHKPARNWSVCKPGNLTQLEHLMFQYLSILWESGSHSL